MMGLPDREKKFDDIFNCFATIHYECDRQTNVWTDRQTNTGRRLVARLRI